MQNCCHCCEALHCLYCDNNFDNASDSKNISGKKCDVCYFYASSIVCCNILRSTGCLDSLPITEQESFYMREGVIEGLEHTLMESSWHCYVSWRYRNILLDILNKLEEDTSEVINLRKVLSKSTAELPYIGKLKRDRMCVYLNKWKPVFIERGKQVKNKFLLRN